MFQTSWLAVWGLYGGGRGLVGYTLLSERGIHLCWYVSRHGRSKLYLSELDRAFIDEKPTVLSISSTTLRGAVSVTQSPAGDRWSWSSVKPRDDSHSLTTVKLSLWGATSASTSSFDNCWPYCLSSGSLTWNKCSSRTWKLGCGRPRRRVIECPGEGWLCMRREDIFLHLKDKFSRMRSKSIGEKGHDESELEVHQHGGRCSTSRSKSTFMSLRSVLVRPLVISVVEDLIASRIISDIQQIVKVRLMGKHNVQRGHKPRIRFAERRL